MESYVVRIYRYGGSDTRKFVGTAELVLSGRKSAFTTVDELWSILRQDARAMRTLREPESPEKTASRKTAGKKT
jgi:hypothetical protein